MEPEIEGINKKKKDEESDNDNDDDTLLVISSEVNLSNPNSEKNSPEP